LILVIYTKILLLRKHSKITKKKVIKSTNQENF